MKQTKEQANAKRRERYRQNKLRKGLSDSIKTASDLKHAHESYIEETHFFTRETMKFFGDTMRNYGLRRVKVSMLGQVEPVEAFELYRKRAVKHGLQTSAYFSAETFERVFIECEV